MESRRNSTVVTRTARNTKYQNTTTTTTTVAAVAADNNSTNEKTRRSILSWAVLTQQRYGNSKLFLGMVLVVILLGCTMLSFLEFVPNVTTTTLRAYDPSLTRQEFQDIEGSQSMTKTTTKNKKNKEKRNRALAMSSSSSLSSSSLRMVPSSPSSPLFVIIIGAGAAGLGAAHKLRNRGITNNFVILEATQIIGGRFRKDTSFLGYPIELGATEVFDPKTVNQIMGYNYPYQKVPGGRLVFSNYSYYDYFSDYVAQPNQTFFIFHCQVTNVDYSQKNIVQVQCADGRIFYSQYTIVTVSLQILRDQDIQFRPRLPRELVQDHPGELWQGIKVFITFSKHWFVNQTFCLIECPAETDYGESYFWDQTMISSIPVLTGLFVGSPYNQLKHLDPLDIVHELMKRMEQKLHTSVIRYYQRHLIHNWTAEPFVRGTYTSEGLEGPNNVNEKVFLAGEAYPVNGDEQGWVHTAFNSGRGAAHAMWLIDQKKQLRMDPKKRMATQYYQQKEGFSFSTTMTTTKKKKKKRRRIKTNME